jgi:hypothetical protein
VRAIVDFMGIKLLQVFGNGRVCVRKDLSGRKRRVRVRDIFMGRVHDYRLLCHILGDIHGGECIHNKFSG